MNLNYLSEKPGIKPSKNVAMGKLAIKIPSKAHTTLNSAAQDLVLHHRITARKLARHMLNRWNARLDQEEIDSVADLALCEAASGFDPDSGSAFSTYLFYFLKGSLIKTMRMNKRACIDLSALGAQVRRRMPNGSEEQYLAEDVNSQIDNPDCANNSSERNVYLLEIRNRCNEALLALSSLEREIVVKVHIFDYKVASVARRLGYSRGHVSNTRKVALKKLQQQLSDFDKEAA